MFHPVCTGCDLRRYLTWRPMDSCFGPSDRVSAAPMACFRPLREAGLTRGIRMLNSPGPHVGLLAQLVEQRTFNPTVQGSSP